MTAMGFAATAFGKRFRLYSIATLLVCIAFGTLTGLDVRRMVGNQPTPWMGIFERINIFRGLEHIRMASPYGRQAAVPVFTRR